MSTDSLGFIADAQTEIGLHDSEINDTDRDTHGQRDTIIYTQTEIHKQRHVRQRQLHKDRDRQCHTDDVIETDTCRDTQAETGRDTQT